MKIVSLFTMFALVFQRSSAFGASAKFASRQPTKLSVGFLDEISKSFSTAIGGGKDSSSSTGYYTVGITGAGGLIGSALRNELFKQGTINNKEVKVIRLIRNPGASSDSKNDNDNEKYLSYNPNASLEPEQIIDPAALEEMDAIVHLAGENISTGQGLLGPLGIRPWTDSKKASILSSRVDTTSALAKAIAASKKKTNFIVSSGVGVYGSDFVGPNAPIADESSDVSNTSGFLAEVSRQWEGAAQVAKSNGSRVVNIRNGIALSKNGGVMAKLLPIFMTGGGGNVGSGQQYFPVISARDNVRAIRHILETPSLDGPVNLVAPNTPTNAEFTKAFGKVLNRPTILPFPEFAVKLLFGEMGEELLLGGTRVKPTKLLESGFAFEHPTTEEAIQSAMNETI